MRIVVLFLVMMLVACGAGVASGTMPDAGSDAAGAEGPTPDVGATTDVASGACDGALALIYTGRCVPHTNDDCNGVACRADMMCYLTRRPQLDGTLPLDAVCVCPFGGTTMNDAAAVCLPDPARDH